MSLLALANQQPSKYVKEPVNEPDSTDLIKLEPIKVPVEEKPKLNGILKSPSESIRNRLSSGSSSKEKQIDFYEEEKSNSIITSPESRQLSTTSSLSSRANSAQKLVNISDTLESAIKRAGETNVDEFDNKLGGYYSQVMDTVKNCSDVINGHKENLKTSREQTQSLMDMFEETKNLEQILKDKLKIEESKVNNEEMVEKIFKDEYKFQTMNNKPEKQEPLVKLEKKKKLLAALKAIDNGESFESSESSGKNSYTKQLFGNLLEN